MNSNMNIEHNKIKTDHQRHARLFSTFRLVSDLILLASASYFLLQLQLWQTNVIFGTLVLITISSVSSFFLIRTKNISLGIQSLIWGTNIGIFILSLEKFE